MGNSMCFRLFFLGGQNLCVSRYFLFEVDRIYVFPDIIFLVDRTYVFPDIIFLGDRTYVFPDIIFLVDRTYVFPDIIFLRGIELMCFQIFFRGQNLCVSRYFS